MAAASQTAATSAAAIENPEDCEVRSVIRFLWAKKMKASDIHRELCSVYGENVMCDSAVRKWCRLFQEGRTNVHDEPKSGRPSVITDDLVNQINEKVRENRKFTITDLSDCFPQISRSLVHNIVTEKLGYHKFCARWVPKLLSDAHKMKRMGAALTFLERYDEEGDKLLDQIVTGDETWVSYVNVEQKAQSREWGHTSSPRKPVKCRQTFSTKKLMATVFWDRKDVLLVEFMERGTTINSTVYCETLKKLRRAIQNKRRGMLTAGIVFVHDNARPHTAVRTRELLDQFGWDVFDHPPYSPDLAPSDYHLFPNMKKWLGSQRFMNDNELKAGVNGWLSAQAAEFYASGIEKLVPRYDKCLNVAGNYVEK